MTRHSYNTKSTWVWRPCIFSRSQCPWPPPARCHTEHSIDELSTPHIHPSMILAISTVNLKPAAYLFTYRRPSMDGDGCASHFRAFSVTHPTSIPWSPIVLPVNGGWYTSYVHPSILLPRSTSLSEPRENLQLTYLLAFIHGCMFFFYL